MEEAKDFGIHPVFPLEEHIVALQSQLEKQIAQIKSDYEARPTAAIHERLHERVADLYASKVGLAFTGDQLAKLYKEGEERYKVKTPPGFKDAKKAKDPNATPRQIYGDFLVWRETINHAKAAKQPVILAGLFNAEQDLR
jgi:PIN like domain